ncbi:sugar transferase [Paenibacillus cellulosilyticus]|uniref:sugar transferase n=1 Tax=Paenibacillus cellulosilyticus TaxID=375489 RepID=UPI0024821D3B|nr:sugar transferase [Paenibacillus cellulosilyticus]
MRAAAKRAFDLAVSVPAFVALLPVYGIVALLVRLKLGSPVLFRQKRPGRHGMPFMMHKFRTMTDATDASGQPLPDEVRLTAFGRLLRKLSLDELPQLLNVIRGEMSLVGPRPLLMEYLALYTEEQGRRHDVRPGITGWAQVNGRNELSWDEKFKLDVDYVDRQSFGLDLRILAMTAAKVWKREGIAQPGKATMSRFTGEREAGGVPW